MVAPPFPVDDARILKAAMLQDLVSWHIHSADEGTNWILNILPIRFFGIVLIHKELILDNWIGLIAPPYMHYWF